MDYTRNEDKREYITRKTAVLGIDRVPVEDFTEVATLLEAKAQLKVDFADEDTLITELIPAARRAIEDYTGLSLVETEVTVTLSDPNEKYYLPYGPYIETFVLKDWDDTTIEATNYTIGGTGNRVYVDYSAGDTHTITYTAGFTDNLPTGLKRAVLLYVEYLYDPSELGKKSKEKALELAKTYKQMTWLI